LVLPFCEVKQIFFHYKRIFFVRKEKHKLLFGKKCKNIVYKDLKNRTKTHRIETGLSVIGGNQENIMQRRGNL